MNRRQFLALSTLAGITPGPFAGMLCAEPVSSRQPTRRSKLNLSILKQLLSTPQVGFPALTPTFAAMFGPGTGPIQLVRSETFDDFTAQTQAQSNNGYVLSALTTIQNLNRTWFYGAYKKGTGSYQLLRTTDPNAFQQMFTQLQSGYTLVDFNIAWEQGTLYYTGYWLASAKAAGQMLLWDIDFPTISTNVNSLLSRGSVLTRVQPFPKNAGTSYSVLFAPGNLSTYIAEPADTFFSDVSGKFAPYSLNGLGFDPVSGNMFGCWVAKATPSQFIFNQDWDTLATTAQQASGMVLTAMAAYPNAPDFADFFATNEAPFVKGYAYAIALNGQIVTGSGGFARSSQESVNPNVPFTAATRMNIASVSKAITGIALEVFLQQTGMSLDAPFWPLIQSKVPNPDPSVKTVTLRNLAEMKSGMVQEANEGPLLASEAGVSDIYAYLNQYLAQPLVGTPGVTYYYDNANFTILQAVINLQSGMDYVTFVTQKVLVPAGVDPTIFNATPDDPAIATLQYSSPQDTRRGNYWPAIDFVAPGGWISSARELVKVAAALRGASILPQSVVSEMFSDLIGWDNIVPGNFGTYYEKNGMLSNASNPPQSLNTCLVRLGEGYDAVLIANTEGPLDVSTQVISAFNARGVPLASEPPGGPSLTTVVQGASFLPACAPGSYLSIIGSGFPSPAASWAPTTNLPTELNGVQVHVGGQSAYIAYAGPTQINFLAPSTVPAGLQPVYLTMPAGGINSQVQISPIAPGLFSYVLNGVQYPAALIADSSVVVAAVAALSGSTSRPATAGDFIELYGTGMGPTNPAAPDGVVFSQAYPAANLAAFQVTIGGVAAPVSFAGLVGPGLYQLDIQIPTGLSGGDQPLVLTVGGAAGQPNLMLTISA